MRAIALGRTARHRHRLEPLVGPDGLLDARNASVARRIAARLNAARVTDAPPDATVRPIGGGEVAALAALGAVLHEVVRREREAGAADLDSAAAAARKTLGTPAISGVRRAWRREFVEGRPATATAPDLVGELLVLAALNTNPAAEAVRELIHDGPLRDASQYDRLLETVERQLRTVQASPPDADAGAAGRGRRRRGRHLALPIRLREPASRAPRSLADQLRWIQAHWPEVLAADPGLAERVSLAIDLVAEETRALELRLGGAGPFGGGRLAERPDFRGLDAEPEAFSADLDWMPRVVLIAKSTHVWFGQLAQTYDRPVTTLADVPDEELDRLAVLGVTGLWLIGLWQRSRASADIKRRRGALEAVASAYSIDEYRIADDLGGEVAFVALKERAAARGIRIAADMVPNHMGIDSHWVREHPERFISVPESPYEAYTFSGPNLSPEPSLEITLEDHYWDDSEAAVVFRRVDRRTGDERFIYHGNDGTFLPWNDTAQLDFIQAEVREAVTQVILEVARRSPILRFDAAMVLARRHIRRLWYPAPGKGGAISSRAEHALTDADFDALMPHEFWRDVVDRVAREVPGTLLLAEAFWLLEGYFVRTLGMHRVYNSAFMHMLRDEDNAGYRKLMRDTLEFDPGVLQRFVNFMTNPDELAAAEQFGTGDKAFAVATLLATMPGLPMLGHGQVEGFRERYGMEFRQARWEEPVDRAHGDHFERTIVPLLRRRAEFAGTERFHLYDAVTEDGAVNDDVYAFSNGPPGQANVVLVHNRFAEVDVRIDRSVRFRKAGHAVRGRLATSRLADDLELRGGGDQRIRFVDRRSGWQVESTVADLRAHGLAVHLGPYEARVLSIELVADQSVVTEPAPTAEPAAVKRATPKRPAKRPARRPAAPRPQSPKSARRRSGSGSPP
jgi:glycosidase